MSAEAASVAALRDGAVASPQPRGLYYLAFTEAWERFSYYGMTALLALYMVNALLLPGRVEQVGGFSGFRSALESLFGPLSVQALASQIFGLYSGFVYFTPVVGGLVADRWIGQRNAVVIGALAMSAGHLAMTFDRSFLAALLLLVIGSGLLKGNIAAQVGALYPRDEEARRARGFVVFSTAINIGAIAGPLVCGLLAQVYGWHYGFGIAAVCMLVGLATYLAGARYLPARVERQRQENDRTGTDDGRIVRALVAIMIITIFHSTSFYQCFNVLPIWIQQHVSSRVAGLQVPVPWYASINAVFSVVSVPVLFRLWARQAARGREPDEVTKIGIGAAIAAASNLVLVAASVAYGNAPIPPLFPFLYSAALGVSFLYYWPTLLAVVSRAAPAKVNSTLMGCAYLSLFVSNNLIGWLGGFYERMTAAGFWAMHAAIGGAGALLVILFGARIGRALRTR